MDIGNIHLRNFFRPQPVDTCSKVMDMCSKPADVYPKAWNRDSLLFRAIFPRVAGKFFLYVWQVFCLLPPAKGILLVSYRLYRVEVSSFLGRIPAKEHTGNGTYGKGEEYTPRLYEDGPVGNAFHYPAGTATDDDTDDASGDADKDGLDQELAQDVDTAGSDAHAQADFACTFRDRYIHDVHDADAAYNE